MYFFCSLPSYRPGLLASPPPTPVYIKSSQAASPRAPEHMRLQTTKLRPFLVFTGLYLAASLPSGTNHVAALTPTRICASIWREPGPGLEEVGEEWGRLVGVVRSLPPAIRISSFIPIKRLTCFGTSILRLGKSGQ
jgi:hypothetical protein